MFQKFYYYEKTTIITTSCYAACIMQSRRAENIPKTKGKINLEAMITIKGKTLPAKSNAQKAPVYGLTSLEVVEQAQNIKWSSHWFQNENRGETIERISRVVNESQRDFEIPAIKMYSIDIIDIMPHLVNDRVVRKPTFMKDFIYGFNVVITDNKNDTIAFVPDSVINHARPLIEQAFNDSNYTECYRLFNEAFTFYPLNKAD